MVPAAAPSAVPGPAALPGEKTYVVVDGDSFTRVAKKLYGDGLWKKLAEANSDRVKGRCVLRRHEKLRAPSIETLTGKAASLASKPASAAHKSATDKNAKKSDKASDRTAENGTEKTKSRKPESSEVKYASYTVKKGDTLGTIAQRTLGFSAGRRAGESELQRAGRRGHHPGRRRSASHNPEVCSRLSLYRPTPGAFFACVKGRSVFGKCVLVILAVCVLAARCWPYASPDCRPQARWWRIQLDIREQDEELWLLRTQIAQQVTPDQVRQMMSGAGPLEPMVPARNAQAEAIYDGSEPAVPRETPGAPSGNGPAR